MDVFIGIILGLANSLLMVTCFMAGVYMQRKWSSAEIMSQARLMVNDLIYVINNPTR